MGSFFFLRLSNPMITSQGKCSFLKNLLRSGGTWKLPRSLFLPVASVHLHFVFSFKELVQKSVLHSPQGWTLPRGNLPFLGGRVSLIWERLLVIWDKLQMSQHKINWAATHEESCFPRNHVEVWIVSQVSLPEVGRDALYEFDQHFSFAASKFCECQGNNYLTAFKRKPRTRQNLLI